MMSILKQDEATAKLLLSTSISKLRLYGADPAILKSLAGTNIWVGWRGLEAVVAACPRLEAVDLSRCVGVGDREAAAVARGLREVRLDKCLEVTDVGLARVAVGCGGRLERLGVKWCMEISDIGVELLVKKCRGIKALDVSYLKVKFAFALCLPFF
ncbi:uncharacterized protein A4U43_UnF770 [Asparagus officinalis]|uniref:COI1 F-box domain-containing protein n=1 Tax=Asparagus officinalis TaxID=4686 RepID=A0A1R3L7P0_ASPOF|nr:uncharacterized protein A4U43_UnF770 [Asparagus officinalis]